jgi:hypothetical protein
MALSPRLALCITPYSTIAGAQVTSLPSDARAVMLIASTDGHQKPIVNLGATVWSVVPPAPGQRANIAIKAEADIPNLKMHVTMILTKNTDSALKATHIMDLKFSFADGAPITGFKDVGLPQVRELKAKTSESLTSVKVKISDVHFLIALIQGSENVTRNLDLLTTRAWLDFPLLLKDGRVCKLAFQKSAHGQKILANALDVWQVKPTSRNEANAEALASLAPASTSMSVSLQSEGGTFVVPVTINGQLTLSFVIDSGASDVSIPADVVLTLVRTGTITDTDFIGKQTYRMADGSAIP